MKLIHLLKKPQTAAGGKSQTVCLAPIGGCLLKAENMVGSGGIWRASNDYQHSFIKGFYTKARGEICKIPELESIASPDETVINRFLAERGFQIELAPLDGPPAFAVASVFKLLLEWFRPGTEETICKGKYPAVRIGRRYVSYQISSATKHPIVSIPTKNGDVVHMTVVKNPGDARSKGFDLLDLVERIEKTTGGINSFNGVVFPMIDYDEFVDISWAVGLETTGVSGPWIVSQALQQTKFRMNEIGAKVESAVAMGMRLGCCAAPVVKPDLIIDQPFLLWITRESLTHPLFIAHFTEVNWKKPKKL